MVICIDITYIFLYRSQRVDISRVMLPFTSIISDGIIVITFNITIADDTIITVITTGAPVYVHL